jgi:hypothetical protein
MTTIFLQVQLVLCRPGECVVSSFVECIYVIFEFFHGSNFFIIGDSQGLMSYLRPQRHGPERKVSLELQRLELYANSKAWKVTHLPKRVWLAQVAQLTFLLRPL